MILTPKTVDKVCKEVLQSMRTHILHNFTRACYDLPWLTFIVYESKFGSIINIKLQSHTLDNCWFLTLKHEIKWQMMQSHNAHIDKLITTNSEDGSCTLNPKKICSSRNWWAILEGKANGKAIKKASLFSSHFKSVFVNKPKSPQQRSFPTRNHGEYQCDHCNHSAPKFRCTQCSRSR